MTTPRTLPTLLPAMAAAWGLSGCAPTEPNDLDKLPTIKLTIGSKPFLLWIADEEEEQRRGLMYVTADKMQPLPDGTRRGMIFVFAFEAERYFWMKNTVIPLDIAYLRTDGTVVSVHTMPPLTTRQFPSNGAARFAIEVTAGTFSDLGIAKGSVIEIPPALLNPTS